MRVSTSQIYDQGSSSISNAQSSVYKTYNQIASGKKYASAEDNPVAAARVLLTSQSLSVNSQYASNQETASSQLSLEESQLQLAVGQIQNALTSVTAGRNGTYTDSEREDIADALESAYDSLMGLANSTDANGYYLFSGYQGTTKPFVESASGTVTYEGDSGERLLQVGSERQLSISDSGDRIFQSIATGNGTYAVGSAASNTGSGVIDSGTVTDSATWASNADTYTINFTDATHYEILDSGGTALTGSPFSYTSGSSITDIPGISIAISGTPATGDQFTVEPSTDQSVFTTLKNLISAFRTNVDGDSAASATQSNIINAEYANLNQALDNVTMVRSNVGSRMNEIESLQSVSSALDIQYQAQLSDLSDLDYASAITDLYQQKLQLTAAQNAFSKISSLSLFNYIG